MHIKATPARRADLPLLENALLWCLRAWVIGQKRDAGLIGRIESLFAHLRAEEGAVHLDAFMWALCGGAARQIAIECVCNPHVSADEALFLDLFALRQEKREEEAHALALRVMSAEAACAACGHAGGLVRVLGSAGHALPRGPDAVRRCAFLHRATPGLTMPASALAH